MPLPLDAPEVLEREYLQIRAWMLQIGAALDRIDRADDSVAHDPRLAQFQQALEVLAGDEANRAEAIQLIFSREYQSEWREEFGIPTPN